MISYMQVTRVEIRVILCVCVEGGVWPGIFMWEPGLRGGHGKWVNFNLYCMKRHSRQQK